METQKGVYNSKTIASYVHRFHRGRWSFLGTGSEMVQNLLSKLCSDAGLKIVEIEQYFFTLDTEEGPRRKFTMPRNEKKTRARGWFLKKTRIGPVLDIKFVTIKIVTALKFWLNLCFKTEQLLGFE